MEGAGEWTLQLSHKISPLLLLLPPAAPLWGPSPAVGYGPSQASRNVSPFLGCQFFQNCSSMSAFHGMLSFRQGHSSCQKTCSSGASSSSATAPARNQLQQWLSMSSSLLMPSLPALVWLLQRLQCECVTPWSFVGCSGTAFLTMVFSMGLEHVLP